MIAISHFKMSGYINVVYYHTIEVFKMSGYINIAYYHTMRVFNKTKKAE